MVERQTPGIYHEIPFATLDVSGIRHETKPGEFVVIHKHRRQKTVAIKHRISTNDCVEIDVMEMELESGHDSDLLSKYDAENDKLVTISENHAYPFEMERNFIKWIDLKTGKVTKTAISFGKDRWRVHHMHFVDDQIYVFGFRTYSNSELECCIITENGEVLKGTVGGLLSADRIHRQIIHSKYVKARNVIIMYAMKQDGAKDLEVLCEFSLRTKKCIVLNWSMLGWRIRYESIRKAVIFSVDNRYVVRFGGRNKWYYGAGDDLRTDDIVVYDLKEQTIFRSAIKCPFPSQYGAVNDGSKDQDELAVFGFVNQSYKSPPLRDVAILPVHVIQLICKRYCNDRVRLYEIRWEGDRHGVDEVEGHWSVNLDEIIRLKSPITQQNALRFMP